jgi:hypothetical protein
MKTETEDSTETKKREREVRLIMNVAELDPEHQDIFVSGEACLYDICGQDENEIEARLIFYFKGELPAPWSAPVWKF